MPDKELTDAEIVKALKELFEVMLCEGDLQRASTVRHTIDLINRQKAEIEKKQATIDSFTDIGKLYSEIKAEAYKECVEKVKEEINEALKNNYKVRSERAQSIPIYTKDEFWNYCAGKIDCLRGIDDFLDNLLKELVGDTDERNSKG